MFATCGLHHFLSLKEGKVPRLSMVIAAYPLLIQVPTHSALAAKAAPGHLPVPGTAVKPQLTTFTRNASIAYGPQCFYYSLKPFTGVAG